jgi:ParB family chromosome partitioning protein
MSIASSTQPQAPPPAAASTAKPNGKTASPEINPPAALHSFLDVPLDRLRPSQSNPRKHFDGPDMDELVQSVKEKGVLMPILVRDSGWKRPFLSSKGEVALPGTEGEIIYEVVAGERRYRAAKAAGLKTIPARLADLSDREVMEIQIVENLQRKDVTALEEADGYANLFKQLQISKPKAPKQELVGDIATKIGKSVRYVYARMKLTELHEDVKKALGEGEIPASHADELVRLQPADQKKALREFCFDSQWNGQRNEKVVAPVRKLKEKIERGFTRNLFAAPWKHDDATLLPLAGACNACPKNTANHLDGDPKAPTCIDLACYGKKENAFIQITLDKVKQATGAQR